MYIKEFGDSSKPKILLIHPMLMTGESMYPFKQYLGEDYCYIIPFLDAHTQPETEFDSGEIEAERIVSYLKSKGYMDLELIFGSSLGTIIGCYIYALEEFNIKTAVWDCAPFFEEKSFFFKTASKFLLHLKSNITEFDPTGDGRLNTPLGAIDATMVNLLDRMSADSVRNLMYTCTHFTFPRLTLAKQRRMFFNFGAMDFDRIIIQAIKREYPLAPIEFTKDMGHCEYMLVHPEDFCTWIKAKMSTAKD